MRLGLRYVKGLSEISGLAIERERKKMPFSSIDDLHQRVPELRKDELRKLAAVGALNFIQSTSTQISVSADQPHSMAAEILPLTATSRAAHRRDALWQVERVTREPGPLFAALHEQDANSPLAQMNLAERMNADFRGTGLTIGTHPVAVHRSELNKLGATRAIDIYQFRNGQPIRVILTCF